MLFLWNLNINLCLQYDAASRVIARLKKERDEARALLAQAERQIPSSIEVPNTANSVAMNNRKRGSWPLLIQAYPLNRYNICMELISLFILTLGAEDDELGPSTKRIHPGISSSIISDLADCNTLLSQQRKKRQVMFSKLEMCPYGFGVPTRSNFDLKFLTENYI